MAAGAWQPLTGPSHQVAVEILLDGPLSRAELSRRLGLSPGSLTRITKPMVESGLLVEVSAGPTDPRVGRPSQPLDIDPTTHHFVGVKLTADAAVGVLTTLRAEVIATEERPLPDHTPQVVADLVVDLARSLAQAAAASIPPSPAPTADHAAPAPRVARPAEADHVSPSLARPARAEVPAITGIGVSLGGHVTRDGKVLLGNFLDWTDVPLQQLVATRAGTQVVVANDVTAVTEAIHWFGAGRGVSRFCLITIGAGVGYGLVVHDKLVDTVDTGLGLIGHFPLDSGGPICPLGHRGCAEAMLTTAAITGQVGAALGRPVEYDECLDLAKNGEPAASRVVATSGRALGRLIAAATNFTMPELVVLGGEGVQLAAVAHDDVLAGLRADRDPAALVPPLLLEDPTFTQWARGAAVIAIQTFVLGR